MSFIECILPTFHCRMKRVYVGAILIKFHSQSVFDKIARHFPTVCAYRACRRLLSIMRVNLLDSD